MKTLSKEAEALILDSIADVVKAVHGGLNPTDAVVKVAEERMLPHGYVTLVCQAYNTGRQTQQRENHDDILGKTAEFALADAGRAKAQLYPTQVETPGEAAQKTAVDVAYSRPPLRPTTKLASGGLWDVTAPAPYASSPDDAYRRQVSVKQAASHQAEQARLKLAHAENQFMQKLAALTNYFRKTAIDRVGWQDFRENAAALFPVESAPLVAYLDGQLRLTKRARWEPRDRFRTRELFQRDAEPYVLLEGCFKAAAAVQTATDEYRQLVPTQPVKQAAPAPVAEPELDILGLPVREVPSDKEGSFLEFAIGSGVGKGLSDFLSGSGAPKPTSALVQDKAMELDDPNHDAALRKVQAQAMMTDFLANDPVISGFDPDEVMSAYNEIAQVSPRAAVQPALIRPLLRKRLSAGGIEPFEANEIANLEKTLGTHTQRPRGVLDADPILG